jgi:HlyD family secretion protein
VSELKAQLAAAKLAARPDEIRAAQAASAAAREALAQAEWRLEQKSVRAPREGRVTDTLYVEGEWVPAGSPVVTLLPPAHIKVRFFVQERILGSVRVGQSVSVRCDGCGEPIAAQVSYISPQAEYTPPVIYSRENRAKLVFLVEARPAPAEAARLHPGQPVEVRLP